MDDCEQEGVTTMNDPEESGACEAGTGEGGVVASAVGRECIITGCHDFQHATAREGTHSLEEPHSVSVGTPFEGKVIRSYSSAQSLHLFVHTTNGLYSMGKNFHGQCGTNDTANKTEPTWCVNLPFDAADIVKIVTGKFHSIVLTKGGDVYGCGQNTCGQLGLGDKSSLKDFHTFTKISSLTGVVDVAAGEFHSLACTAAGTLYSWGHPDAGSLGNGTDGRFIEKAGKISFHYRCTPEAVHLFVQKDNKNKRVEDYPFIFVTSVAAGKQHSGCIERREDGGRVFTWGCGGYGRLGHATANDELFPREIVPFTYDKNENPGNMCATLVLGNTASCGINHDGALFFWGILPNSPRGEATMYPKYIPELLDFDIEGVVLGSSFIVANVGDGEYYIWGKPVAGRLGFAGGGKTSSKPVPMDAVDQYTRVTGVSAGYGHLTFDVEGPAEVISSLPILPVLPVEVPKPPHKPGQKKGGVGKASAAAAKGGVKKGKKAASWGAAESAGDDFY